MGRSILARVQAQKVSALVDSMAAERQALLTRPCLLDPKLLALLKKVLGQSKKATILGTADLPIEEAAGRSC